MERFRLWLDSMINHCERIRQMNLMYPDISTVHTLEKRLHIYSGIQILAAAVGKDLEIRIDSDGETIYEFSYRGYLIFQI